jgi:hypothetical protein
MLLLLLHIFQCAIAYSMLPALLLASRHPRSPHCCWQYSCRQDHWTATYPVGADNLCTWQLLTSSSLERLQEEGAAVPLLLLLLLLLLHMTTDVIIT